MLKKLSMAVLGITTSGLVSAGTMGPTCVPGNVTVPCETRLWDIGIQALYLRSSVDANLGYENAVNNPLELDRPWDWGFRLEGSYHFGTANDITMNWSHYDVDHDQSGFLGVIPAQVALFSPFVMHTENKFDQVNLVMGQHVDAGLLKNIRFYGGLQYVDIRFDKDHRFSSVPAPIAIGLGVTSIHGFRNADFNGFGPVTGIDYSYDLTGGLSITANAAVALLYGTSRYSSGLVFNQALVVASQYGIKRAMVPELEAKLGLNYGYAMSQGMLNIQAGYQAMNYFNALQSRGILGLGAFTDADYSLYGPYFGLKWVGNA